ncbi:hypothetical protein ACFTWH_04115 [Streptomyces sp. NPDC057011]|uniref:hypothetical protein n=1 Tax=unclassified Streptomyces TaxID=2593676 RepID=UPI00364318C4
MRVNLRAAAIVAGAAAVMSLPASSAFANGNDLPAPAALATPPFTPPPIDPVEEKTERESVGEQQLADGYAADVYKLVGKYSKEVKGYEAEIRRNLTGALVKLTSKNPTGKHDAYTFTLSRSGKVTAVKDQPKGDNPKGDNPKGDQPKGDQPKGSQPKGQDKGQDKKPVTPKGGVKAGAEGVQSDDNAGLIAGGAGAAAVAAAGLGFTLVRRSRTGC